MKIFCFYFSRAQYICDRFKSLGKIIGEEKVVIYEIRMDIAITTKLDPRGNKSGADCFSQIGKKSKYLIKSVESPCTTLQI